MAGVRIGLLGSTLLGALVLGLCWRLAEAQEKGDPTVGRRLAEARCSDCHVVGPASERDTSSGFPSFAVIARRPLTTPMSLSAFLQTPHFGKLELHLSRDEIANLAAYILSLRR